MVNHIRKCRSSLKSKKKGFSRFKCSLKVQNVNAGNLSLNLFLCQSTLCLEIRDTFLFCFVSVIWNIDTCVFFFISRQTDRRVTAEWPPSDRWVNTEWPPSDCQVTAESLLNDCRVTAKWLPSDRWVTAKWPLSYCWMTAEWPPSDHRVPADWPSSDRWVTTEWPLSDHRVIVEWPPTDQFWFTPCQYWVNKWVSSNVMRQ